MYLFHFIVILNPDFNCSNSLLSFSADKVTTGAYNLSSVISNFALAGDSIAAIEGLCCGLDAFLKALPTTTNSLYQDKINVISQLINGISKLLQKLPKYFNSMAIVRSSFSNSSAAKLPTILVLWSNDFEFSD